MNIVCPLCGKHTPDTAFDPSDFEDDIYGVEVTGLGRGRGFAVTQRISLLDDPLVTGLIGDRCLRVLQRQVDLLSMDEDDEDDEDAWDTMRRLLIKIYREADYEFESLEEGIDFLLEL